MDSPNLGGTLIRCAVSDGVGLITLNDPARRNAVTSEMRTELIDCFDRLEARSDVRAVVITGEGSAFCAGAHLGDLAKAEAADFRHIYDAFLRIARSPLPTVAAVNGPAVGAGLNLTLACDVRVAAKSARFVARFLRLGLHPGGGNTWMLSRLVGPQVAAAMLIFGEDLDGDAAVQRGLALRCVEDDLVVPEAILLAGRATDAPRELVGRLKETLVAVAGIDQLDEAVAFELEAQVWSSKQAFFRDRIESAGPAAHAKQG